MHKPHRLIALNYLSAPQRDDILRLRMKWGYNACGERAAIRAALLGMSAESIELEYIRKAIA